MSIRNRELITINYILGKSENNRWITQEEINFISKLDLSDNSLPEPARLIWKYRQNPIVLKLFMKDVELEEKDRLINKRGGNLMDNNKLVIFKNDDFGEIRSITINNEPWFVGKDIAEVLGYSNARKAIQDHVDEEDKGVTNCDTLGGSQKITIINESGLYSLIMSSKLSTAKQFKRWVTSEVLPSIRKNGGYIQGQEQLSDEELMAKALLVANKKIEERDNLITDMKPKVHYYNKVLQSDSTICITSIAQEYGMTASEMNKLLNKLRIQFKRGKQWVLYKQYKGYGYVGGKTVTFKHKNGTIGSKINTEWTQKGKKFIYNKLKEIGIVPLLERE